MICEDNKSWRQIYTKIIMKSFEFYYLYCQLVMIHYEQVVMFLTNRIHKIKVDQSTKTETIKTSVEMKPVET